MTEDEIIKALECCGSEKGNMCTLCPIFRKVGDNCNENDLFNDALDLINRQKAEIERYLHSIKMLENDVQTAKSETIKEFAERLKSIEMVEVQCGWYAINVDYDDIDNLVKEMTEGQDDGK